MNYACWTIITFLIRVQNMQIVSKCNINKRQNDVQLKNISLPLRVFWKLMSTIFSDYTSGNVVMAKA